MLSVSLAAIFLSWFPSPTSVLLYLLMLGQAHTVLVIGECVEVTMCHPKPSLRDFEYFHLFPVPLQLSREEHASANMLSTVRRLETNGTEPPQLCSLKQSRPSCSHNHKGEWDALICMFP